MITITRTVDRLWISALPLVVLLAAAPTVANAQTRIGTANSVQPEASGSVGGTLSAGSGVHANETVKTGSSGRAGLQFNDQSNLSVGPSLQVPRPLIESRSRTLIPPAFAGMAMVGSPQKPNDALVGSSRLLKIDHLALC